MAGPTTPAGDPNNTPAAGNGNNNATPTPRVNDPNLPNEVQGMSPEEVVAFYQNRERQLQQRFDDMERQYQSTPAVTTPQANNNSTSFDWNDPLGSVRQVAPTREEFQQAADSVRAQMVNVALLLMGKKYADWDKWEPAVKRVMEPLPPHLKADSVQWEIAYKYVKGEQYDKDIEAARTEGSRVSAELPQTVTPEPIMPKELTGPEKYVANGLGLTEDKYKEGISNLQGDKWPITFDSRNSRR